MGCDILFILLSVILMLMIYRVMTRSIRLWKINKRAENIVNIICSTDYVP